MEAATVATSSQRKLKRKRTLAKSDPELDRLNSLPWNSSLPQNDDDDAFSIFIGSNELEGGSLSQTITFRFASQIIAYFFFIE